MDTAAQGQMEELVARVTDGVSSLEVANLTRVQVWEGGPIITSEDGRILVSEECKEWLRAKCHASRAIAVGALVDASPCLSDVVTTRASAVLSVRAYLELLLEKHLASAHEAGLVVEHMALKRAHAILSLMRGDAAATVSSVDAAERRASDGLSPEQTTVIRQSAVSGLGRLGLLVERIASSNLPAAEAKKCLEHCRATGAGFKAVLDGIPCAGDDQVEGKLGIEPQDVDAWSSERAVGELALLPATLARTLCDELLS